jgi:glycosyltransferase involved in cell wall biosynthesis
MISRLLVDKGVREYVEAAKIVRSQFPNAIFQLAGYLDENPSGIKLEELQSWIKQGNIQYLGEIDSVQNILNHVDIMYYHLIEKEHQDLHLRLFQLEDL